MTGDDSFPFRIHDSVTNVGSVVSHARVRVRVISVTGAELVFTTPYPLVYLAGCTYSILKQVERK